MGRIDNTNVSTADLSSQTPLRLVFITQEILPRSPQNAVCACAESAACGIYIVDIHIAEMYSNQPKLQCSVCPQVSFVI